MTAGGAQLPHPAPMPSRMQPTPQLGHRPDIDGLRALAILPVVLYHAGLPGFGGGFVGVDIFFVISGFLITRLIHTELDAGRFSLANFYARRLRRIAPALLAMLIGSTVAAYCILLPPFYVEFSQALLATLLFGANFHQILSLGNYFAPEADTQPLLHMWSLAVEEQFYLLFPPLLLWLSRRCPQQLRAVVAGGALVSLAMCVSWTQLAPGNAFYAPYTRAWELLLGALLALGAAPRALPRALAEALAATGLLCIAISVTAFSDATPFPGWAALLPCAGAALCIHANSAAPTRAGRLLSGRAIVYIGLISYSLYLWHWPLLVLGEYLLLRDYAPWETALVLALSLLAAMLSYHFIEQPCRRRSGGIPLHVLLPTCLAIVIALALVAAHGIATQGAPERAFTYTQRMYTDIQRGAFDDQCTTWDGGNPSQSARLCLMGTHGSFQAPPGFLLWGDSHARAQRWPINALAKEYGVVGHLVQAFPTTLPAGL